MKRWKKILGTILAGAVIVTGITVPECNVSNVKAKDYGISNPRIGEDGSVTWDKIKFGSYKQSVKFGEAEPIKWRILSVDENNNALLMADKGLDCKQYHNQEYATVTWETCKLREWLNDYFLNIAFSEEEQEDINLVTVKNDDNPEYGTEGGKDTEDKVYLLSIEEVCNSSYGFESVYDKKSVTRECKVTDYAYYNGAQVINNHNLTNPEGYEGNCFWWLRSPAFSGNSAAFVYYEGTGIYSGSQSTGEDYAVRPVIQINLSSSFVQDAGEVYSNGSVSELNDGYHNPKKTDNETVWDCVYFGRYEQSSKMQEKEPIEWRVLQVDGDEALLLADKGLDNKPYNEEYLEVTWETCTLRTWLNETFYNEAFTEEEQHAIKQVTVKNNDNYMYDTEGGNDTTDKVYLLSIEEVSNTAFGFDSTLKRKSVTRECKVTDYARMHDAYRSIIEDYAGNGTWWLRTPGGRNDRTVDVHLDGLIDDGTNVQSYMLIRPALRIDLSSSEWENSGTVSTGTGSIDISQTTPEPDSTPEPDATQTPDSTDRPDVTQEPANTPAPTIMPDLNPAPTIQPSSTPVATQATETSGTNTQTADAIPRLKSIKLTSVKCKKGTKQISGKVSVSGATVKIKVGSKAYKKAAVKGKKFTLKVPRLKKNTKVTIKVTKSGYKSLVKTYRVK